MSIILLMREVYNQPAKILLKSPGRSSPSALQSKQRAKQPSSCIYPLGLSKPLRIGRDNINKAVEIYSWRSKTSLPVLRIEHYSVSPVVPSDAVETVFSFDASTNSNPHKWEQISRLSQQLLRYVNTNPEISFYQVSTKIEDVYCRLIDLPFLSFPQAIHLLKEMLIGFEVLIDIFGIFQPDETMLTVSRSRQWKIWPNADPRINEAKTADITFSQFIFKLASIAEKFSQVTSHSKSFFHRLHEYIRNKPCSFIKTLELINEFIGSEKILQVKNVILPIKELGQLRACINRKAVSPPIKKLERTGSSFGIQPPQLVKNRQSAQQQTPEKVSPGRFRFSRVGKEGKPGSSYFPSPPKKLTSHKSMKEQASCTYMPHTHNSQPSVAIDNPKHASNCLWPENSHFSNIFCTPSKKITNKGLSWHQIQKGVVSNESCKAGRLKHCKKDEQGSWSPIKLSQSKHSKGSPQKFPTMGTIMDGQASSLFKIRSTGKLPSIHQKASQSSIFSKGQHDFRMRNKKYSQNCIIYEPIEVKMPKEASHLEVKCLSPHNSSSTKELHTSGEMPVNELPSYSKLKEIDLVSGKQRNNHSVINNMSHTQADNSQARKNLALSHQFHDRMQSTHEPPGHLDRKDHNNGWNSIITDLFNDTRSIKVLKESIKMRVRDEEVFEKEHLKDVKLELLGKLGRNANHVVIDDEPPKNRLNAIAANYKSMQLIEEEIEEIKSVNETERDHYTLKAQEKSEDGESGFNFQTQLYVINPRR